MIEPFDVPRLETPRLTLRRWSVSDAEDMFEYASDPEVTRFAMWPRMKAIEEVHNELKEAEERYAKRTFTYWGLELKENRKFIGSVGFPHWRRIDNNAEIGFALNRMYWNKGLMTEAVTCVMEFGWTQMQLHRMEAKVIADNAASIRILGRAGFQFEGTRKEAALVEGKYHDVLMYGKIR